MEPWEIENLRRSVAMLPPGHTAGALSKDQAEALIDELLTIRAQSDRYRQVVDQLRNLIASLDA